MANAYYGRTNIVGELSDAQDLPSATAVASDSMVYIGGQTGGKLWIDVYANTALSIATGQLLTIEIQGYTADTTGSATSPFSTANQSGIQGASGTLEDNAHYCLLQKTTADDQLDFTQYSLITQGAIPEDMFRLLSYDWVQLYYTTDANESSELVDAFVYVK